MSKTADSDIQSDSTPLEDFFENGTVGLHLVAADGRILRANRADHEPLGYAADEYVGRHIAEFHADPPVIADILARLARGEKLIRYPARLKARDGSIRHVEISSSVSFRDGAFANTRCFTVDVTDKVEAERQLEEARQRLAATYERVPAGIGEVDADGRFLRVNEAFSTITGFPREELLELDFFALTHPDDVERERQCWAAQVEHGGDYQIEKRYVRRDGQVIWVEVISSTVRNADGSFRYGIRHVQDITVRKEAEARQRLLLDELNHRVKNTLATVQAIAAQTAKTATTAADFRTRFEPRLRALSAAHDRLTQHEWRGANLRDIVVGELAFHAGRGRRLEAEGPDVMLNPRAALSLSLALHELATNAVKHGALSAPDGGRVAVSWRVQRGDGPFPARVDLSWVERGGPPIEAPTSQGFGSRLLRVTAAELRGDMEIDYPAEGLRWSMSFPLESEGAPTQAYAA